MRFPARGARRTVSNSINGLNLSEELLKSLAYQEVVRGKWQTAPAAHCISRTGAPTADASAAF